MDNYIPAKGAVLTLTGTEPKYQDVMGAGQFIDVDWAKGYDAFQALGLPPIIEDQGSSLSCTAQATKQYVRILAYAETKDTTELSARSIYSQTHLPNGGAVIWDAVSYPTTGGIYTELKVPDYLPNHVPPTEEFMETFTSFPNATAWVLKEYHPRVIDGFTSDINAFAHAILNNHGVVGGFTMSDEGWCRPDIRVPLGGEQLYGHCVFLPAFGLLDIDLPSIPKGTKCVFTPNSWGGRWTITEGRWKGYQAIPESYFVNGPVFHGVVLVPNQILTMQQKTKDFLTQNEGKLIMDSDAGATGTIAWIQKGVALRLDGPHDRAGLMALNYLVSKDGVGCPHDIWLDIIKPENNASRLF